MKKEVPPSFDQWFQGSKVVNLDGSPRRLFHGTRSDVKSFDAYKKGQNVDNPTTRFGFYFTADPEDAGYWAQRRPWITPSGGMDGPVIMPVYLVIKNPIQLSDEQFLYYLKKARVSTIDSHLEKWTDAGHDGIFTQREGRDWYVAFSPDQIKSAIGNKNFLPGPDLCDLAEKVDLHRVARAKAAMSFLDQSPILSPKP